MPPHLLHLQQLLCTIHLNLHPLFAPLNSVPTHPSNAMMGDPPPTSSYPVLPTPFALLPSPAAPFPAPPPSRHRPLHFEFHYVKLRFFPDLKMTLCSPHTKTPHHASIPRAAYIAGINLGMRVRIITMRWWSSDEVGKAPHGEEPRKGFREDSAGNDPAS